MRTIRAYVNAVSHEGEIVELPASVFQHLVKVLRLSEGKELQVFNGLGRRFNAVLSDVAKKHASLTIQSEIEATPPSPLKTHMGIVMSKGDRFDYAIQKATELGVTEITPLTSERCDLKLNTERAEKKLAHWRGVIVSACEQSYQDTLPTLHPIQSISNWISNQTS